MRHCYAAPSVELPICVAVRYLTLRKGGERYGRKNPLPFPFSQRSHVGNLRQIRKQGKGRSSKRKENRRLSFLFAHRRGYGVVPAAGRGTFPPSADGESPAEVQRKTPCPSGANTLTQFAYPAQPVQKRSRPSGANPPAAVRVPRSPCAEKRKAPQNCFHGAQGMHFYSNRSSVSTSLRAGACGSCAG